MITQFSYCSNLKVSDLIFALQILLCGAGEGLAELSTLFLVTDRKDPSNPSCCRQQRIKSPLLVVSQVLNWCAGLTHSMFHSDSLLY